VFELSDEPVGARSRVITVAGELDVATSPQFEAVFSRVLQDGTTRIVVDLASATFLDSTALSWLLACARHARRPGGAMAIVVGPGSQPGARFDLTGTREVLNVCDTLEEALAVVEQDREATPAPTGRVVLRLYVNGRSRNAAAALKALDALRRHHLPRGAQVDIVDVADQPDLAERRRLLATPALDRLAPPPARRIIGDLSDLEQVLLALDLEPR
jgi:circadian clock protein KaiB